MYAGKTETVISHARRYRAINKKVLFINSILDNRYSEKEYVVSHNGTKEDCLKVSELSNISTTDEFNEAKVVIIEEAQFFPDLIKFFKSQDLNEKHYIVSGLAGDYQMNPIGDVLKLIPMAEHVEKINGFCKYCKDGTIGAFTRRKTGSSKVIEVGGEDKYECVCRLHFN